MAEISPPELHGCLAALYRFGRRLWILEIPITIDMTKHSKALLDYAPCPVLNQATSTQIPQTDLIPFSK